jgi:hypothetical protein
MNLRFKRWLEAVDALPGTEPFTANNSDRMRLIQQQMLDKAVRTGDTEMAQEIIDRMKTKIGKGLMSYSDDAIPDFDFDDKGNPIKPSPPPVDPAEWRQRKMMMYQSAMRRGDLAMAQSIVDDLQAGPQQSSQDDDDSVSALVSDPDKASTVRPSQGKGSTDATLSGTKR